MCLAAGLAHRRDLVIERLPFLVEDQRAVDDDVDLTRALVDRVFDFGETLRQRRQAGRESRSPPKPPECRSLSAP